MHQIANPEMASSSRETHPPKLLQPMPYISTWDGLHVAFQLAYELQIGSKAESFGSFEPPILGPISGEGVFKPQGMDE